ncbi:class I SAM-dependent methyltransferase [Microcoleus sp.]|uniref:class I SAM-dependent methyltransferase n=1 Tax=Microcoleus sp. TaxID=44472 RepID=UPI0035265B0C
MAEINLMDRYPRSKRPIEERGKLLTEEQRAISGQYGKEYFDGDRIYGYGGYYYHPRFWQDTVKRFRDYYNLPDNASILDVGCGKGFMLYDFKQLMPQCSITGIDISEYAITNAKEEVKSYLTLGNAKELPYPDNSFDLVICINTVHQLPPEECNQSIREIQRVTRGNAFMTVDSWRNEAEKEAMLKWFLTAKTFMSTEEWVQLFDEVGYKGDYYWFIAE